MDNIEKYPCPHGVKKMDDKKINVTAMSAKEISRAEGRNRAGVGAAILDR